MCARVEREEGEEAERATIPPFLLCQHARHSLYLTPLVVDDRQVQLMPSRTKLRQEGRRDRRRNRGAAQNERAHRHPLGDDVLFNGRVPLKRRDETLLRRVELRLW
jgi:hypothetical protein